MHIPMSNSRIWIDVKYKKLYIMKVEIADLLKELFSHKETYRSGHNGAHSKDFYLFDIASPKALKILISSAISGIIEMHRNTHFIRKTLHLGEYHVQV